MRINAANCVLLACLALALAAPEAPRSKRHLQQWKDVLLTKFFCNTASKEENIRFFRIPGHENILVKAVPKIDAMETSVLTPEKLDYLSSTIAILQSYLGTKSASETLSALQGVKQLLQSGVLSVRHEPSEVVPYEKSAFLAPPFISERIEFVQPRPAAVISGPPKIPLIPVLPPAAEAPQVIEEIIPMKVIPTRVPELVPYPKLSCKQMKKDGSVVTHTVTDVISSDVVVTETDKPLPRPPPFDVDRLRKSYLQLPLGTQNFPVHPLPPMLSPVPLNPIPFNIYSKFEIPPIHKMINVPKGEVQVHTYPARKVHIDDKLGSFDSSADAKGTDVKIIAEEPALMMPPPPPFIVNRIENAAALSATVPKADKPTEFQIVDKEDYITEQKLLRNPGQVFYNSQPFAAALTSEYIYRPPSPLKPNQYVNLQNEPANVSKDAVIVTVNRNHVGNKKPKDYYNQQSQYAYESKFPLEGWREVRPNMRVTKPVEQMPVPPVHIIKRIENVAAKAHAVPKISRGYAFKINNPPFIYTNNKESTEQPITYKVDTKPSITKEEGAPYIAESVPFSYVYKQISQNNPQPFTLVQLEDKTTYKPAGPVMISHKHARPDGSTYKCKENHHVAAQFPEDYYYVPPVTDTSEVHLPTMHKVEKLDDAEPQFSYVQATNNGVYTNKDGTAAFKNDKHSNVLLSSDDVKVTSGKASSKKNPEALSGNPIVVPETTYSFTQIHSDGSTTKVHNDSGKGVTVDLSEGKKSSPRGDIPETFA